MTDFSKLLAADRGQKARPIHLVDKDSFEGWARTRPAEDRALMAAHRFDGKTGFTFVLLPRGEEFEVASAVANVKSLSPWCLAKLGDSLPEGTYKLESGEPGQAALGWLLAQHRFDAFKSKPDDDAARGPRILLTGEPANIEPAIRLAEATILVRDLVNTPALQLGPAELEQAVRERLSGCNADVRVTSGEALRDGYPLIAAVGAAASPDRAPRLIEAEWGDSRHPRIAIVGKGVCFDSGGISIKPSENMGDMKHDKSGAAAVIAAVRTIARLAPETPLMAVAPMVENMPGGNAQRPGDVVRAMNGMTVEVTNTDAEGRLILGDAMTWAEREGATHIVDIATLTGAQAIAFGDQVSAYFARPREWGERVGAAAEKAGEWFWEMPLVTEYRTSYDSPYADIVNSGTRDGSLIKSAIFLAEFATVPWVHVDIAGTAYLSADKPHGPKGSTGAGVAALVQLALDFAKGDAPE